MILPLPLRRTIQTIAEFTEPHRLKAYAVGGFVRDWLLGIPNLDLDLTVEGDPAPLVEYLAKKWKGRIVSHPQFMTFSIQLPTSHPIDIARTRTETYPHPAALPVVQPGAIHEDLWRRDFSINAMAIPITDVRHWVDPCRGVEDLKAKKIRALHEKSFIDDPTRIFRAARFAGRFGFQLETKTRQWLKEAIQGNYLTLLSKERLKEELLRILAEKDPYPAWKLLQKWNALDIFHPQVRWNPKIKETKNPLLRLGLLGNWVLSLPIHKEDSTALRQAYETLKQQVPARHPLPWLAQEFLKITLGQKQWRRISSPLVNGEDLKALGFKPETHFRQMLQKVDHAQWKGKINTKKQAMQFLLEHLPRN